MSDYFRAAVRNVAKHGDTDVLPFPIENHVFFDREDETVHLLEMIHNEFDKWSPKDRVDSDTSLVAVGYTGFRLATQVDPIWNAYLLGLVISIGAEIESKRIPVEEQTVFSYRFNYDEEERTLFARTVGWAEFQQTSLQRANDAKVVVISDISDFYPRIYHHRLENALGEATANEETIRRIMLLLKKITKHSVSYGLPVGGPAARLLSELVLNRVDQLLGLKGIQFCRFADDYHIFAPSREDAYASLMYLSQLLYDNEGLSLQKSKTRVMSSQEFSDVSDFSERDSPDPDAAKARSFLTLKLRFDPYSPTAKEDYKRLKEQVKGFDIGRLLGREMEKSRVHPALTRRLLGALQFEDPDALNESVRMLVENLEPASDGISRLFPVIPNVMILLKEVLARLRPEVQTAAFSTVRKLIWSDSLVMKLPSNLCYAIRFLADDPARDTDALLDRRVRKTGTTLVKRDVILIMARRKALYWLSDLKGAFTSLTSWEKRTLIVASFVLGDEGEYWRGSIRHAMTPLDELLRDWAREKSRDPTWRVPV